MSAGQATIKTYSCVICKTPFQGIILKAPRTCGALPCRAKDTWGKGEWDGYARLARARQRADIPLTDIDREALRRAN